MKYALVLVCVVALLAGAAVLARRELAAALVRIALARAGFAETALVVDDVGARGVALRELRAQREGAALEVRSLALRWSLARIARGRIDELRVDGVVLRANLRGTGETERPARSPVDLAGLALALPHSIQLEDARIELDTDLGLWTLQLAAHVREAGQDLVGEATLELERETSRARFELSVRGAPDRLTGTLALRADLAESPELPLALSATGETRLTWSDRVLELYTPACLEVRLARFVWESIRLEAPLDACVGEPGARALRLELPDGATARYRVDLALHAAELRAALGATSLRARAPRLSLQHDAVSTALELAAERAEAPSLELRAEALQISARLQQGALEATVTARALRDLRAPATIAPVALSGTLERSRPGAPLSLRFELAAAKRRLILDGTGSLEPDGGGLRAQLRLRPLAIGPGAARLAELSPRLAGWLGDASGRLEASASVAWSAAAGPQLDIDLALREAGFATRAARFAGMNGRVRLQGPSPWRTPPDQLVSVALTEIGIPLTDGLLRFQIQPGGVIDVESAVWRVMGGTVSTQGPLDLAAEQRRVTLAVKGLDLTELAKAAQLNGLSGTGTLDGALPLRFSGTTVFLDAAELRSSGAGGVIQYRPGAGPDAAGTRRPELVLALRALEDFHYDELRLGLNGDVSQAVTTELHLRGSNPAIENGRPIEFNIKLDAPLATLLRTGLATYRLPEAVERRLRDFPGAELP